MPGAGAATVAFAKEDGFQSLPTDPAYFVPGYNVTVDTIEASNALERLDLPDQAEPVESIAGNFETGLSASWAMSADRVADVQDIVFNDAGTGFVGGERAATSTWYLGLDHLSGSIERELTGVYPTEYALEWSQDSNTVTVSLTAVAADEGSATSITPTSIQGPGQGEAVPSHGAQLDVDAVTQTALQSFTLSISNIAQPIEGASRHPLDAVCGRPETTLDWTAVMKDGPDQLSYVYDGTSSGTETADEVAGVSGTITLNEGGATATTFNLSQVTLDTGDWDNLVSEENAAESASAHVNGVSIA